MAIVYIALGSNVGNRQEHIRRAQEELTAGGVHIEKLSAVIETEPWGGPAQGDFLNAVLRAATILEPLELLKLAKSIEGKLGRVETVRNGPRTIDIDILLYDQISFHHPQLEIPHPRMLERDFVMLPLREIAPELTQELLDANRARH